MKQSWIFQGNPDLFPLNDNYLKVGTKIRWAIRQKHYKDAIKPGDIVYIWRSDGSGGELYGGLIAKGRIVSKVDQMTDDCPNLWKQKPDGYNLVDLRVDIELDEVRTKKSEGMLRRYELKQDDIFKSFRIMKLRQETNYLLSEQEANYTDQLWNNAFK